MILARLVMPQYQKENVENHNEQNSDQEVRKTTGESFCTPCKNSFEDFRIIPIVRNHLLRAT